MLEKSILYPTGNILLCNDQYVNLVQETIAVYFVNNKKYKHTEQGNKNTE